MIVSGESAQTPVKKVFAMELAHSLLLNEDALAQITEAKRPVFIFEWLRFLDKVLVAANKVSIGFLTSIYIPSFLEHLLTGIVCT